MSTQADHGHELIPRPQQTPDALRAALEGAARPAPTNFLAEVESKAESKRARTTEVVRALSSHSGQ
ncbi:hypothetical protein [Streptomyces sp. NPDC007929]|uniref:hypothetical protein n=1 Tax=unclassified Streptomyces TaxID=2593676 RepID=UPI0036EAB72D